MGDCCPMSSVSESVLKPFTEGFYKASLVRTAHFTMRPKLAKVQETVEEGKMKLFFWFPTVSSKPLFCAPNVLTQKY